MNQTKTIAQQLNITDFPFEIKDQNGNQIYFENQTGYWEKREYDSNGNKTYYVDSNGFWVKREWDSKSNLIYYENSNRFWVKREVNEDGIEVYYENSDGYIADNRPKAVKNTMERVTEKPKQWITFNGKATDPTTLGHQHLSNIYWYHKILCNIEHVWVLDAIRERFNGQLLPYSPHIDFTYEINALERNGFLHWQPTTKGEAITVGTITFQGQVIGSIWKYNS